MGRTRRILGNLVVFCIANIPAGNCFAQASAGNWNAVRGKTAVIASASSPGGAGGDYLPLAGGTLKGPISFDYADSVGLDLKGKNIVGVSTITVSRWRIPDYVFAPDYPLRSMESVETFIKANSHLPNIPSEKEVRENGVDLVDLNFRLLEKIEELTLYTLRLNKELEAQGKAIKALESKADSDAAELRTSEAKP